MSFQPGGSVSCRSAFCASVSRAGGAWCVPRETTGIPSDTPSGLCAEWRLRLRCVPLPAGATLARGWLWQAGRAGAVVGTGPAPGPQYKYPSCRRLCLLGPSPGAVVAARQVLGVGVTRPQHRHFLLARQATASMPLPAPFLDGIVAATPPPGLQGPPVTL